MDYAGPIQGKWILVIVDAHSKYLDALVVSSPSSAVTERMLRCTFATHGSPHVIVSDNASSFTSQEFSRFCALNGLKHVQCAPYHPSSNGLAECAVQNIKSELKKVTGDLETRLLRVLAWYRLLPQSSTGQSPAMLLMGHQPRSRLDLVYPDLSTQVTTKIDNAKRTTDKNRIEKMFHVGDTVSVVNFQGRPKWLARVLEEQLGRLTFRVRLEDGRLWKRHVDHIRVNIPTEPVMRGSESQYPGNLWGVGNKQLQGTQHLLHSFLHPTEIAAPQQLVIAWKMNIPEPTWEHVCRNAKKRKEGTMLRIKPKDSTSAWNQTQKGNGPVPCS